MSSLLVSPESNLRIKAQEILQSPAQIVDTLYAMWSNAFFKLHGNKSERPNLLQYIGVDGLELFRLNQVLTTFLMTQLSGVRPEVVGNIQYQLTSLPNFIFNQDGSVIEVLVTPPSATSITYSETLSDSVLVGGTATIPGTFVFADPNVAPNTGTEMFNVNFIPTDTNNFKVTVHPIEVITNPANLPSMTFTPPQDLVFDGNSKAITITTADPSYLQTSYTSISSPYYQSEYPPTQAGSYTLWVNSINSNYVGVSSYNFTITPANLPTVTFTPLESLVEDGEPKYISAQATGPITNYPIQLRPEYLGINNTNYNSATPPTLAGDYTLTVTSIDPNYTGSSSYNFTITPAN